MVRDAFYVSYIFSHFHKVLKFATPHHVMSSQWFPSKFHPNSLLLLNPLF